MEVQRSFSPAALIETNPEETLVAWRNALPVSIEGWSQLLAVNKVHHTQLSDVYILQGPDGTMYAAKTPKDILPESLLTGPNVQTRRSNFIDEAIVQPSPREYLERRTSREFMAEIYPGDYINWSTELEKVFGTDWSTIHRFQQLQHLRQASHRIEAQTLERLRDNKAFPYFYEKVTNTAEYENPDSPWYHKVLTLMEYIPGPTLDKWLEGNQPVSEKLKVMQKLLAAIGYLHQQGIFHADLKPRSVIVDQNIGDPRIIDFGSVTVDVFSFHARFHEIDDENVPITEGYSDPRLRRQEIIFPDAQSDLYSFGRMLYDCFNDIPEYKAIAQKAMQYGYESAEQMQQALVAISF